MEGHGAAVCGPRVGADRPAAGGAPSAAPCARSRHAAPRGGAARDRPGAPPPGSGQHGGIRQGGPRRPAHCRPVLAGGRAMSDLSGHAGDYLRLRRALGHKLDDAHRLLPRFVAYLDSIGAETVTVEAALAWARRPDADPASSLSVPRMTWTRAFTPPLSH